MKKLIILIACCAAMAAGQQRPAASAPASDAGQAIALRGGRLLTVSKGVIENGVVVMQGGKITAVGGAETAIPRGARVIDVQGMTVYPGLIDSETQLGLTEVSAVDMTNDLVEPSDNIMPHMRVPDAFHAESQLIPVTRVNGITNAVVMPTATDTLPGQASLVQLAGRDRDEMILVPELAIPLNFTGEQRRRQGGFERSRYPFTRMGVMTELRQAFADARDYEHKWVEYKQAPAAKEGQQQGSSTKTPPKRDLKLEALLPYLKGEKPFVVTAEEASDLKVALQLVKEFKLKVILNRVTHAQSMLDTIAAMKLPVIVTEFYEAPKENERYDMVFRLPAELHRRGIKFAFGSSDAHQVRNLPYAAGYAVGYGLPYEQALRAITLSPAEIWGVADRLGSLDVGKIANVVVANGDPLDVKTDVKQVFIGGEEVPMDNYQIRLRDQYMKRLAGK